MSKTNIIAALLFFFTGFALCFFLFNIRVNLGWSPIFEMAHLRQPTAYENKDCLKYNWLVDNPNKDSDFDQLIDSEFVFCLPTNKLKNL